MEEKRLGDVAVTEGWAMLMQHLTDEPAWLSRKLDFPGPEEYAAEGMLWLLFFVRRYSAKLLYELEFHSSDDVSGMAKRYAEVLGDALKFEIAEENYLADMDSGFYVTAYLRSWAFECQLRDHLRERFGTDWFTRRAGGSLLRALWAEGQGAAAEGRRAAEGRLGLGDRDVRGRRPRARTAQLVGSALLSPTAPIRPGATNAHCVIAKRGGLCDLFGGNDACFDERSTWGSWRM